MEVQKEIARKNYTRAKVLYEEEDFYPAYEMIRQAVEFDPGQKEYWVLLARIQRKNPKWVRHATETMRRAVKYIPENVELWWELAEACLHERNEPERVKALKEVMRLDPANRAGPVGALRDRGARRADDERPSPALRDRARPVGGGGPQLLRRAARLRSDGALLSRGLSRARSPACSPRLRPSASAAILFLLEFFADKIPGPRPLLASPPLVRAARRRRPRRARRGPARGVGRPGRRRGRARAGRSPSSRTS